MTTICRDVHYTHETQSKADTTGLVAVGWVISNGLSPYFAFTIIPLSIPRRQDRPSLRTYQ